MILFTVVGALSGCAAATTDEPLLADLQAANIAAGWDAAETLHANTPLADHVDADHRNVHSLWIAGSHMNPVPLTITATAADGDDVRIAVLGPLVDGTRAVLASDGYASAEQTASVTLDVATRGEHLVVVGSRDLSHATSYELRASCSDCESRVDVLASPKTLALVGTDQRMIQMQLGDVLTGLGTDVAVAVDVYASAPMQPWTATRVATSYASGMQVNAIVPASVHAGDDVRLVVRTPARTLDTGIATRFAPGAAPFARLDAILYGDVGTLQIAGVAPFFEGIADLRLHSETYRREIAAVTAHVTSAGQAGNGLGAFDALFSQQPATAARDGELLSIGVLNGNGDYQRMGCFEYCNNLSGLSSCTGGPRTCPMP